MKGICTIALFILASALFHGTMMAQATTERLKENSNRAGCLFHSYEFKEINDSKPPKGYKPFYVSHYGRHGSRYHADPSAHISALHALNRADSTGNLTPEGIDLKNKIAAIHNAHKGMWGHLTARGVKEQKALAGRLFARVPEVFTGKERILIDSYSSDVPRCIMSMASFTGSLISCNPSLEVSYETGARCSEYLRCGTAALKAKAYYYPLMQEEIARACNWDKTVELLFKDPSQVGISSYEFADNLWGAWAIGQCLDMEDIDIYKYFTVEQLYNIWKFRSHYYYLIFVKSDIFGDLAINGVKGLLRDFISKADAALNDGKTAATIRFGHDSTLMPFAGLIGLEDFDKVHSISDSPTDRWDLGTHVCMGSSIQLIFYKNKSGNILVKFIYNEQESAVPALTPVHGKYYYEWNAVRKYLEEKAR